MLSHGQTQDFYDQPLVPSGAGVSGVTLVSNTKQTREHQI
jgi:hypothetical protein